MMLPQPRMIVQVFSEHWCSAIQREFPSANLSWVLGVQGLLHEALEQHGAAVIIEVPSAATEKFLTELVPLVNHSSRIALFAVGESEISDWRPLLAATGFASWYGSLLQLPDLVKAVERHHRSLGPTPQSIESRIWNELPWPTAARHRHA